MTRDTMLLGTLLKVQQDNKVAVKRTSKYNHIVKYMHDSYGSIFLSSRTYKWENNTCY